MAKTADLRCSIGPLFVTHGDFQNFHVQFGSTENQVEIAKRIKITKVRPSRLDLLIIALEQNFGPTEGVLNALVQ